MPLAIGSAVALFALVASVVLAISGAPYATGPAAAWTRRLNAVGLVAPCIAFVVLQSGSWDLIGILWIVGGATAAVVAFTASAACAVESAVDAGLGRLHLVRAFGVSTAIVAAYVLTATSGVVARLLR